MYYTKGYEETVSMKNMLVTLVYISCETRFRDVRSCNYFQQRSISIGLDEGKVEKLDVSSAKRALGVLYP